MNTVTLQQEQYDEFIRCLQILKDSCTDVDIRNGQIRQKTNDVSVIFDMNLSEIISELNFPLSNLKQKLDILKCFINQEVTLSELPEERSFGFSDQFSNLKIKNTSLDFLDNKFITNDDLNAMFTLQEEDLILECTINRTISNRMKVISQNFSSTSFEVSIENNEAKISSKTQAKDQSVVFIQNITTNKSIESSICNLVPIPFIVEHDGDIEFKMYIVDYERKTVLCKFKTLIGSIDIVMYSRGSLISSEDEE